MQHASCLRYDVRGAVYEVPREGVNANRVGQDIQLQVVTIRERVYSEVWSLVCFMKRVVPAVVTIRSRLFWL